MNKFFIFLILLILLIIGGGVGGYFYLETERKKFNNTNFAAKINGRIISLEEFEKKLNLFTKISNIAYEDKNLNKKEFRRSLIEKLIEEELIFQEMQEANLEEEINSIYNNLPIVLNPFPNFDPLYSLQIYNISIENWEQRKKEVALKNYFFQKLKENIPVLQEELTNYYTNHPQDFYSPEKYKILHMQVETMEIAEYLYNRILKGANFADLIDNYSLDEKNFLRDNKGFIVEKGELPEIFEKKILQLRAKKNKTALIPSPYGVHLFLLKEIIPANKLSFTAAKSKIIDIIQKQKSPAVYANWLKKKKKNSQIFINQQFIENESSI